MLKKILNNKQNIFMLSVLILLALIVISIFLYIKFANVHIVFNTDKNYKDYTKVAIKSAILNKNKFSIYNINVLCVDLTEDEMNEFKKFASRRVKINLIPLKLESIKSVGNYQMNHHVSRADLFKFFLPEIFPHLNKILYIDSDTLILQDLSKLYHTNISKYPLAAVKKNNFNSVWEPVGEGAVRLRRVYTYNCGVLLFNLNIFRKNFFTTELIVAKNKDKERKLVTQTSFNDVIPIDKVKLLSPIYNTYSRWENSDFDNWEFKELYSPFLDNIIDMDDLRDNAVIVHFAGSQKPWLDDQLYFADQWWEYAKLVNPNWKLEKKSK